MLPLIFSWCPMPSLRSWSVTGWVKPQRIVSCNGCRRSWRCAVLPLRVGGAIKFVPTSTPWKINMEHHHGGLVDFMLIFQGVTHFFAFLWVRSQRSISYFWYSIFVWLLIGGALFGWRSETIWKNHVIPFELIQCVFQRCNRQIQMLPRTLPEKISLFPWIGTSPYIIIGLEIRVDSFWQSRSCTMDVV